MITTRHPPAIQLGLEKNTGAIIDAQRETSRAERRPGSFGLFLMAGMILATAIVGCGGARRDVIGKWRGAGEGSTMIWEFTENGSVKMGSTQGRYSFGDRERIKIESPSGSSVYQLEVSGERMTLKDPHGSGLEFIRVK